jgi:hypothetical protein
MSAPKASDPLDDGSAPRARAIALVADALGALSIPPQDLDGVWAELSRGRDVLLVQDLGLDSLGTMEFCIHLEVEHGLVLSPDELLRLQSLLQLLPLIEVRLPQPRSDGGAAAAGPA